MKVYLAASASNTEGSNSNLIKIISLLKKLNHKIVNPYFNTLTSDEVNNLDKNENVYKSLKARIEDADCVVAEITYPSVSLGIQLEYALTKKIPVLTIYNAAIIEELPLLIRDYNDPLLFKQKYTNKDLESVLNKFFKDYPKSRIKFNMFITHEIDKYLNIKSAELNITKAEVIRRLIEKDIKANN